MESYDDRQLFLEDLVLQKAGVARLINPLPAVEPSHLFYGGCTGSACLDNSQGDIAPQAAGVIHTDFEKGFIRAEGHQVQRLRSIRI